MIKLKLDNIRKTYQAGTTKIEALKEITLKFCHSEFVSILGPSGCGKTTLLNIIGGLDRYDSGDLLINGLSTKEFSDSDWDAYRNLSVGFVFQNYNLITHQSVLKNVEIAMTLSGVSAAERKNRAAEALNAVGLADQINKRPSQLSGGQMQRVAIARALVNNPDIILADEPTGALDSKTSQQIMEILREVAKERLVLMVTHNSDLADEYSSRVIRMLDGKVQSDSNPVAAESGQRPEESNADNQKKFKKPSMSLLTAASLSFNNLLSKKGRTIITAFAGSIGIIGVALVLALSAGLSDYINEMQADTLSEFPISIGTAEQSLAAANGGPMGASRPRRSDRNSLESFPDEDVVYRYERGQNRVTHRNVLTTEFLDYIGNMENELPQAVNTISYTNGVEFNVLAQGEDTAVKFETNASGGGGLFGGQGRNFWQEMPADPDFILSLYELLGEESRLPQAKNEVALVVDQFNRLEDGFFERLGMFTDVESYDLNDFIGQTILKVVPNDQYYQREADGSNSAANRSDYDELFESDDGTRLIITGILRIREDAASSFFSEGIVYTTALTEFVVDDAYQSEIAAAQRESEVDVLTNNPFPNEAARERQLVRLGAITTPTGIDIYPNDFAAKDEIKEYLDAYNEERPAEEQIIYTDLAETITNTIGSLINTVTYVLVGFAAISLVVSTIMIGIITYVSVIERTKEIGILRSIGARKKDISRVFNAETLIVGLTAGLLGIGLSYLLIIPINAIIANLADVEGVARLTWPIALLLVVGSMALTLISGLIPARIAANKDPVVALRTE